MSILEKIKQDSLDARKAKTAIASFLVTLYAEAARVGKDKRNGDSTDEEVISVLKKFKAGAETMIQAALQQNGPNAQILIDQATVEIKIVGRYLPTLLTESDLHEIISKYFVEIEEVSAKSLGVVMARLKSEYPGLYDGQIASSIIKQLIDR